MEKKKIKWIILLAISIAVFVACAIILIIHLIPKDVEVVPPPASSELSPQVVLVDNPIDFKTLKEQNNEICAWISLPGCDISYPVLQSSEDTSEDFYLTHNEDKKAVSRGAIYIQKLNNNDFSDPNTIIYGHNMLNGSMFGRLKKFRNKDFFNENEYIYIYTPGHILTYKIYSAFLYDDRHILNSFNFYNSDEFSAFIEETLNPKSMVKNLREGVSVTANDRIISLSTCTSVSSERYLVEGVLINDQLTK